MTRDQFQARLDSFRLALERDPAQATTYPLVVAMLGELGSNAFDHNLGSWRDEPGIYFRVDPTLQLAVIADRGQGVLASLRHALPNLATEQQALEAAFTQHVSGRAPERRGNGLKFVASVVNEQGWSLAMASGEGRYTQGEALVALPDGRLNGVLAVLTWKG